MHKLLFLITLLSFASFAQEETARANVKMLCSPAFHGRGYVNGGDSLAAEYIAQQFQSIGCSVFNNDPFQRFTFPVNRFPDSVVCVINNQRLTPGNDFVVTPDMPKYKGTFDAIWLPAWVVDASSFSKWSTEVSNVFTPSTGIVFTYEGFKGDTLKFLRGKIAELGKLRPLVEVVPDKFTWSVEQEQRKQAYVQLLKGTITYSETPVKVLLKVNAELVNHTARNVVAFIPAKKKSNKYVVFTAHYDHLGQMGSEAYFPGGNDNASGSAMLIELARYYKTHPQKENILFIAFAGEEVGLLGSQYYTEHPLFPLNNIKFLFNIDIMGSGEDGVTIVNGSVFPKTFNGLVAINDQKQYVKQVKIRGKAANSDHYFFTEKGVPAFFMYTMGPNKHYHDVGDTYNNLSFAEFNDLFHLLVDFQGSLPKKIK